MSFKKWTAGLAVICLSAVAAHATPALEAYGQLPSLSDITLSPDGTKIAFVRRNAARSIVVVEAIGTPKPISSLDIGERKLRWLQWADNTKLLITTSVTTLPAMMVGRPGEYYLAQYLDTTTNMLHRVLSANDGDESGPGSMNIIEGVPQPRIIDGHTVVFVPGIYFPNHRSRLALFRQDLTTGVSHMVSRDGDMNAEDWLVDDAGNIVAETNYYESNQRWSLSVYRNGDASKPIDVSSVIEGPDIQGLSEDGSGVVVRLPITEEGTRYEKVSIRDGGSVPWHQTDVRFDAVMHNERTGRVIGAWHFSDKSDYAFFDPHAETAWRSIKDAFSDATDVQLVSWSEDFNKVVALVFGGRYGARYFFVDLATGKADAIGPLYDGIDEVAPVNWIDYTAGDGRVIHAYLTLPMNRAAKNLPLVVLPHGGPHSRDWPGFDWLSQAFASQGYAVLQPQFRGSEGFGKDLLWAGFGEFGKKMQTDLSDGVRALAEKGVIDPKRVCIVGASYGGYAALAGATLDTGVYRCAVSDAGISDLHKLLADMHWPRSNWDNRGARFWDRFLDVKSPDDPKLDAISPIRHIDKITIPILLTHGTDDTIVPISQSEDMADALKAAGKQVEFVKLEREDHGLSRSATRTQMLQAAVKFVEANNPP